jgi:hypothetical protein
MTPTVFGIVWLATKTAMFAGTSIGLIAGLQKLHDFQLNKKQPTGLTSIRRKRGVDSNVNTSEDASEAIKELRELHTTK